MTQPSSSNKQPDVSRWTFFADRNLGRKFVDILRENGFRVEHLDDHFPQNTPDTEWIPVVASKGWIILTNDKRIARDEAEIEAHMLADARTIVCADRIPPAEIASLLARSKLPLHRYLNKQEKYATKIDGCFSKIQRDQKNPNGPGTVHDWKTKQEWLAQRAEAATRLQARAQRAASARAAITAPDVHHEPTSPTENLLI